jgi:hypothetical protein
MLNELTYFNIDFCLA